ncbi:MAG: endopeptidase La [Ignavibacteria bacterium]|nr:endopeptidase La [Ignavibacteria bacterium]
MARNESSEDLELSPESIPATLPLVPLRDVVIFPHMIFPVLIGRDSTIRAITHAIEGDKLVFVCSQRDPLDEEPEAKGIYPQGTVAKILQVLKLPNGLMKVLVDGLFQAKVDLFSEQGADFRTATVRIITPSYKLTTKLKALVRQMDVLFEEYVKLNRNIPNETLIAYESMSDPARKLFYVSSNILVGVDIKQTLLMLERMDEQVYEVVRMLSHEIEIMKMEVEIDSKVHDNIQRSQRKYYIQEQIRILQNELEEDGENEPANEYEELQAAIAASGMPADIERKALDELDKLGRMAPMSPEATVSRNYLDWILAMPWTKCTDDNLSLDNAATVLNEDHYGLEKPKDRILEHIAVLNLVGEIRGQILCLVGPPGVGKTSLGKSIARALNRKFVRISLGGVHDEAEIRGHRRTYIGSMPGKIIQAMKKAASANPVMLLDEIDKMSNDFQGDPASAMLEVLDPEQNSTFNDHYLDVDFDLSRVLFITTANVRYNIPLPLQDRMEIIELPGYLEHEKLEIAKRHLIQKQIAEHGLATRRVRFDDAAVMRIIREYTLEAGVRNLEREIATVCRKIAKQVVAAESGRPQRGPRKSIRVNAARIEECLGVPKQRQKKLQKGTVGSVIGLAWTSVGGDILHVDVTLMHGQEKLTLTGQLGDVMKESAHAALSYIRSHAEELGVPPSFTEKREIHIHIPEGAIPKDGPSAELTMAMAILSAVKKESARGDVAMTGEITLHGEILPIGGLNEKLLAAKRYGIKKVLIPADNEPDLREVPSNITDGLVLVPIRRIDEAIAHVFGPDTPARRKARA